MFPQPATTRTVGRMTRKTCSDLQHMPIPIGIRCDLSDPLFYDPVIADQKTYLRKHPHNPKAWLKLGRLCEARIEIINHLGENSFIIRYCFLLCIFFICLPTVVLMPKILRFPFPTLVSVAIITAVSVMTMASCTWIWLLRYPQSGKKYFEKVIKIDPDCGEAYMYLGLISFRRFQARKACRLWEKALRLGITTGQMARAKWSPVLYDYLKENHVLVWKTDQNGDFSSWN